MPYIKEHAVRLRSPDRFERFRRENDALGDGIDVIWGIDADGKAHMQALRFDAERYNPEQVREWLRKHKMHGDLEPARAEMTADAEPDPLADPEIATLADTDAVVREARLMVAGNYPDKRVRIGDAELDALAQLEQPVPIFVEHKPTLLLGWLKEVWRKGKELWGRLHFKPHAHRLIEEADLRGLSVGIIRAPMRLAEVSITTAPRVPGAQLFSDDANPSLYIAGETPQEPATMDLTKQQKDVEMATEPTPAQDTDALRRELDALRARLAQAEQVAQFATAQLYEQSVQQQVERWVQRGKLPPVAREPLTRLLRALHALTPAPIPFSTDTELDEPYRALVDLIEKLPAQPVKRAVQREVGLGELDKAEVAGELRKLGFSVGELNETTLQAYQSLRNGGDA